MAVIMRDDEERRMASHVGPKCIHGSNCLYMKDLGAREPGVQMYAGKCVLCNRLVGGYYSLSYEYPENVLIPCTSLCFGTYVKYQKKDYILNADRKTITQCIPRVYHVKNCVETLFPPTFRRVPRPFFIRYCSTFKCTRLRIRKSKSSSPSINIHGKRILSIIGCRRAIGDLPKHTILNSCNKVCCSKCLKPVYELHSDPVHNVVVIDETLYITSCFICNTPTVHKMGYFSYIVCNGCEMHFRERFL